MSCKPTSFHLVENENKENLIVWTYPTITEDLKAFIKRTCFSYGLEAADLFHYKRQEKSWIYIKQFVDCDKTSAIVFTSKYFQPTLYRTMCNQFVQKYTRGTSAIELVKFYLNIYVKDGILLKENSPNSFVCLKDFPLSTNLKDIIKNIGIEFILLYNALLLKKQILVYHSEIEELQQALESITKLMPIRNPEDILEPLVDNVLDLRKVSPLYLKGTTRNNLLSQQNLFDLSVDLHTRRIDVSPKSKDFFQMNQFHKDVANTMIQLAESEADESEIIEAIKNKTLDVFEYLKSFENTDERERRIMVQNFESQKINKNLAKFLINLAVAENINIVV